MDCIFCKIVKGELPGKFVYKDNDLVAFHDIHPKAPVHVLIVPVKHVESLREITDDDSSLMAALLLAAKHIGEQLGVNESGYKVVINNGKGAGQLVFHLHAHLLGGWGAAPGWEV